MWKRLAGQQEGGQPLWRAGGGVYLGLLTHCQTADISLSVGVLGVTSCLSGCVCVCEWTYVFEREGGQTVIHYTPAGFVPSSSVVSPNQVEYTPTPTRKYTLLSYSSQSATLLCWHTVESPPKLCTRTILCYCLWKGLEQFRKYPSSGLGMIGVECKWLWNVWQCTLFADDWVEIGGEETGSESLVINEISLMDMREQQNHTEKETYKQTQCDTCALTH